jgi:two-component system, cell cycle response regulator CpdR
LQRQPLLAETVLVVEGDDEDAMSSDVIGVLGYHVLTAHSGEEAIDMLREEAQIGVLFADLDAPEVGGECLLRVARALRPQLRVIAAAETPRRADGFEIVEKPYRAAELIRLFPPLPLA